MRTIILFIASVIAMADPVTPEKAQALALKLRVASAQMRLQRARAEFAEAKAIMVAAQEAAQQQAAALEALLKTAPGYRAGCQWSDAQEMECPPEQVPATKEKR